MGRTNRERVLDYLWSILPAVATNSQIRAGTGIKSHQQVYLLTQQLLYAGRIQGEQRAREWVFWASESLAIQLASTGPAPRRGLSLRAAQELTPQAFEELARQVMSEHFGVVLMPGVIPCVRTQHTLSPEVLSEAFPFLIKQLQATVRSRSTLRSNRYFYKCK